MGKAERDKGAAFEREIARLLGGKRSPFSGAIGGGDIWGGKLAQHFVLELKKGKQVPVFFRNALQQAQKDVPYGSGKKPMVIASNHGDGTDDAYVVLKLHDFLDFVESYSGDPDADMIREVLAALRDEIDRFEEAL